MKFWVHACLHCVLLLVFPALGGAGALAGADQNLRCDGIFQSAGAGKSRNGGDTQFTMATDGSAQWRVSPQYLSAVGVAI